MYAYYILIVHPYFLNITILLNLAMLWIRYGRILTTPINTKVEWCLTSWVDTLP